MFDYSKKDIMKAKVFPFLFLFVTLVISGCIPSVHPLYTEDDLVFEPNILGIWIESGNDVEWVFEDSGKNSYVVRITEEGKLSNLEVHLVKLDDKYFFDFFEGENDHIKDINGYLALQFIPIHTFVKVIITDEYMEIYRFDPGWLEEILKADPTLVKHEVTKDYILLTASTHELQRFILDYAQVMEAYTEKAVLYRKKL